MQVESINDVKKILQRKQLLNQPLHRCVSLRCINDGSSLPGTGDGGAARACREFRGNTALASLSMRIFHGELLAGLMQCASPASLCQPCKAGNPPKELVADFRRPVQRLKHGSWPVH